MNDYATKEAFAVYMAYLALGKHFTSDGYDYQKYRGKVKASAEKFSTRNDVFFFYKLSKHPQWFEVLLSNFLKNPKMWIRNLLDETAEEVHRDWKKRIDSLTYTFKSDLSQLDENFQANFFVKDGQMPPLMSLYLQKKITLETLTILAHITNVLDYWSNSVVDRTISRDIVRIIKKYYPFLEIDRKKFSEIVKDRFEIA